MALTRTGRIVALASAAMFVTAATAAALTGGFGLLEPDGDGETADLVAPAVGDTAPPELADTGEPSGETMPAAEETAAPEPELEPTPVPENIPTRRTSPSLPSAAAVVTPAAAPTAAKPPTIAWVNNRNGTYTITWANMTPWYSVYVDGVLATSTNKSTWVFTSPGPGAYAISVVDPKGVTVNAMLKASGLFVQGSNAYGQLDIASWYDITDIAAGASHTVGLTLAGSVRATGKNTYGQCDTTTWTGITDVEAGWDHTLGIRSDGTVVATGRNDYGQTDVTEWTDIQKLAAGTSFSVGLKSDGTVVAAGRNQYGQCNVTGWTDIVDIACGSVHTLGLKSDGTVLYAGPDASTGGMMNLGQGAVGSWTGISPGGLGAGNAHSLAVAGGSVLGCGSNISGQFDGVSTWADIVAVDGGVGSTIGLKADGTAVVAGDWWDESISDYAAFDQVADWTGVDAISAQGDFVVGLVK